MEIREYIESGVLELYVYDQLSPAERREVEAMCAQHPEVQAELEAIEATLHAYATASPVQPPAALRERILSQLDLTDAPEPRVVEMKPQTSGTYLWLAAASVVLCVLSLGGNWYQYTQNKDLTGQIAQLQTDRNVMADNNAHLTRQINTVTEDLTILSNPSNVKVELAGLPLSPAAKALIYWDQKRKSTYINTAGLPPLAQDRQYQLWAIVDGKPVDLGILPLGKQEAILAHMGDVSEPQAFAITIEPKGGSAGPTLDQMIVMGKL